MNAIVAGKQEKQAGSLVFKTEQTLGLWQTSNSFYSNSMNHKYLKFVTLNDELSIICVYSLPKQSTVTNLYLYPVASSNYIYLSMYVANSVRTILFYMWDNSNVKNIGDYFKSIELGTLE
ncbi:MAG TPA: hypothetical protein DCW90_05740 [Lachnospiraceae bacterium]|nr:hypothetical protein [Lachnospiraceae bacterium]